MILDTVKAKRLWAYLRPYWHIEALTFALMAMIAVLGIALPAALQYLIDTLIPSMSQETDGGANVMPVAHFGLFLVGVFLAQGVLALLRDYIAAYIGSNIIANMRSDLFAHIETLSLRFYQKRQVGEMMSRILSDVNRIQGLLTVSLLSLLTNLLMLAAILVYLFHISWYLTLIALIPVPMTIYLTNKYGRKIRNVSRSLQEKVAQFSSRLQETFVGIRTVKAFGQENAELRKTKGIIRGLTGLYIKMSVTSSVSNQFITFFSMLGPIVVLSWGTYMIAGGAMLLGELVAFYVLLTFLYTPIQGLASINIEVQSAMASVDRVFEYFDIKPDVIECDNPVIITEPDGEIELENVCFTHETSGFKIEDLSLRISPREKVALVGPSGSGKTTITNLIMRLYDPDSGTVSLDGVDLRKLSTRSLRDQIALVDQDPLLFKSSIYENISYSKPDASVEEVIPAAKIANIHDYILSLPDGYDSEVGERGITLSGGEKQRICLARAILRDPAVLILDEATSALDSRSEQLIQQALETILVDKTAIIIAHRLSTVRHVDRIIVLDNGRVVDEGTHESVMDSCPLYSELASKQLRA